MERDAVYERALEIIDEKDPQSETCGPLAPQVCENNCIGCIARAALQFERTK